MVEQVLANTGRRPEELSADAGYFSEANLKALSESGIEPFIPPEKVRHGQWRERTSPRGRIPGNAGPRYLMSRKLRTKRGRERYRLRQTSVEPVFGHIKEAMGFRQLPPRGLDKARSTWRSQCAAFNARSEPAGQLPSSKTRPAAQAENPVGRAKAEADDLSGQERPVATEGHGGHERLIQPGRPQAVGEAAAVTPRVRGHPTPLPVGRQNVVPPFWASAACG